MDVVKVTSTEQKIIDLKEENKSLREKKEKNFNEIIELNNKLVDKIEIIGNLNKEISILKSENERINNELNNLKENNENNRNELIRKLSEPKKSEQEKNLNELKNEFILGKELQEKENLIKEKDIIINELNSKINTLEKAQENKINNENKKVFEETKEQLVEKYEITINLLNEKLNQIKDELEKEKKETEKLNSIVKALDKQDDNEIERIKKQQEEYFNKKIDSLKEEYEKKIQEELEKMKESLKKDLNEEFDEKKKEYNKIYKKNEKAFNEQFKEINNKIQNHIKDCQYDSESDDDTNEIKNEIIIEENIPKYSYECTNKNNLIQDIHEGDETARFKIILKNNGNRAWHEDSKLKVAQPSDFTTDDTILNQQEPEEEKDYELIFNNLGRLQIGEYKSYLEFYSGGEKYGDKLEIIIKVNSDNIKEEIEKYINQINGFRDYCSLNEKEYPNEKILEGLKKNNFDYDKTFDSFF